MDYRQPVLEVFLDAALAVIKSSDDWAFIVTLIILAIRMGITSNDKYPVENWNQEWHDLRNDLEGSTFSRIQSLLAVKDESLAQFMRERVRCLISSNFINASPIAIFYMQCASLFSDT